jgi:outer membrane immunogenic protein
MNKLIVALLSSAALLVTAAAASAADLPARPVYKAPIAAPAFSWTGIYIGGNVGYGWGRTRGTAATSLGGLPGQFDLDGIVGGGQIGANYQIANWVLGVEVDYQGSSVDGSNTVGAITDSAKIDRFGTVRGRLGYAWDRWMVYGTGGYAFSARTNYNFVTPALGSGSRDLDGWAAGGGIEYAFAPNWSAKVEYLHLNLDTKAFTGLACAPAACTVGADVDTVRVGVNYRFSGLGWR